MSNEYCHMCGNIVTPVLHHKHCKRCFQCKECGHSNTHGTDKLINLV
jgi:hypothetical protein